jgi:hypothetical protein
LIVVSLIFLILDYECRLRTSLKKNFPAAKKQQREDRHDLAKFPPVLALPRYHPLEKSV